MKKLFISLMVFAVLIITAVVLSGISKDAHYYSRKTAKIQKTLYEKETYTKRLLQLLGEEFYTDTTRSLFYSQNQKLYHSIREKGISLFAYYRDSLIFWTTSHIPIPAYSFDEDFLFDVVKLKNGWYRLIKYRNNDLLLLGLILIKQDYFINNEFLKDRFHSDYGIHESCELTFEEEYSKYKIKDSSGKFLFGLYFPDEKQSILRFPVLSGMFYFLAIIMLIVVGYFADAIPFFSFRPWLHFISFMCVILLLRYINVKYRWPEVLYQLPLFDPIHFASSWWLPSLGDFILHAIVVTFIILLLFKLLKRVRLKNITAVQAIGWVYLFSLFLSLSSWVVYELFRRLIFDSSISFDLSNLLVLDVYSFIGFGLITLILLNYLLAVYFFTRSLILFRKLTFWEITIHGAVAFVIGGLFQSAFVDHQLLTSLFPYMIFVSVLAIHARKKSDLSIYTFFPTILVFTIYASYLLFVLNNQKEHDKRQVLAFKISEEQDHVAEYLFIEAEDKMKKDVELKRMLFENDVYYPREFFERIAQNYFSGYWSKYVLHITPFNMADYRLLTDSVRADPQLQYYENSIITYGKPTLSPSLYFIDNNFGKINYLAKIEFVRQLPLGFEKKIIFIEFISKIVTQVTGFPELLLDESITRPIEIGSYSYAIYKDSQLNISGGEFTYPLYIYEFRKVPDEIGYVQSRGFDHLVYHTPGGKVVIISKPQLQWQDFLSPFAYLLIYFSFILFLYFIYRYYFLSDNRILQLNFKTRIQFSILSILLISLVVIGLGINNYVITQFNRKNKLTINEKLNSILTELRLRFEEQEEDVMDVNYISYLLRSFSNVFFTDINLYSPNGTLIATSRESVYNEGLLSRQMDPESFYEMTLLKQPRYIHQEKIGDFSYLSAYAIFRNGNNEIIGYLNLPYFLRQKELGEELASSLLALINIYSLLIAVSMLITFVIANRLTEPLTILQEKIGKIRLGRKNEMIDYTANDEIGGLVNEYNRMIRELEASAELLARSEREIAWREMAKQVAHEVKNPLTPMKLSVQYLVKAWDDKRPDFDERLRKFKDAMIEQIETLSTIASEFSYFAKMPAAIKTEMDLVELLTNCLEFYRNNEQHVHIVLDLGSLKNALIWADRDQMLRVFNNLIRNAIQAIPEDKQGEIIIQLLKEDNYYVILVKDNGVGIPENLREKIFAPNFTTKSSGMGLGLAMSKTIIENMEGEISFETEQGKGTTFKVKLKAI